jgi:F-type H+-transporting ATPase subunit a
MVVNRFKSLLVAVLTIHIFLFSNMVAAQHEEAQGDAQKPVHEAAEGHEKKEGFDANEVIFDHILDANEFHFFNYTGSDGKEHHVSIPLPVILYAPEKGLSVFMSSAFHHGEHEVDGYKQAGNKIVAVDPNLKFYNFSLTRNVVQMMLGLFILMWILISMANTNAMVQAKRQADCRMPLSR